MEGEAKGKTFKMKGHTLPGINQRSEGNTDLADGRSKSSAFQDMKTGSYAQPFEKNAAPKQMIDPMQSGVAAGAPIDPMMDPTMQAAPIMKKSMAKGLNLKNILNPAGAIGGKLGLW